MNRDDCLCLACLSHLSQPENKEIITSSCGMCGKTLIARAHPGYQICGVCSTLEQRCMCCGEPLTQGNETKLIRFIRKLTQTDAHLNWQYEPTYQRLSFQLSKGIGQICFQETGDLSFHLQLALNPSDVHGSTLYTYDRYLLDPLEALSDIVFYQAHWEDLNWLTQKGFTYHSLLTPASFTQWFWDAQFAAQYST